VNRIFWDTNLFIYLIDDYGQLSERVVGLRKRMNERRDELCTLALTLAEILIKPLEANEEVFARRYEAALLRGAVIIPFDVDAARLYAGIRNDRAIRPPDRHSARMRGAGACGSLYHERRQAEHEVDPAHPFRNLTPTRVLVMADDNPIP